MPSAPSSRLGLTSPLTTEAAAGPANIATLISQLEASVGMAKIAEVTSAGGAGDGISFASIAANWRHLRIEGVVRSNDINLTNGDTLRLRLNGSSSGVYDSRTWGSGPTTSGADGAGIDNTRTVGGTFGDLGTVANELTPGDAAGVTGFTLDLLDYASAAVWKSWLLRTVRTTTSGSGAGVALGEGGGVWRSAAAVTDLSLFLGTAFGMDAVSRATLYGLR